MMKKIVYILSILISSLAFGQTKFRIHIQSDVSIDTVSVSSFNISKKFTAEFKNGIATIKIPAESSDQYSISIKNKRINGWFNAGEVDIYLNFTNNTLSITKTINSPIYKLQVDYFKKYKTFLKDTSIGIDFIQNAITQSDQDAFILVPINHYLKLSQNSDQKLNFIKQILNKQPKSTKEHRIYEMIESRLEKLKEIKQIDLNTYSLIDIHGEISKIKTQATTQYTVLDFWFTNCPPCIKEHKEMLKNPNIFNDLQAELIGISTDANQEQWVNYVVKKNIPWKNYRIDKSNFDKDLGIWSFPTYIILDKKNTVLGSFSNITDTIEALKNLKK